MGPLGAEAGFLPLYVQASGHAQLCRRLQPSRRSLSPAPSFARRSYVALCREGFFGRSTMRELIDRRASGQNQANIFLGRPPRQATAQRSPLSALRSPLSALPLSRSPALPLSALVAPLIRPPCGRRLRKNVGCFRRGAKSFRQKILQPRHRNSKGRNRIRRRDPDGAGRIHVPSQPRRFTKGPRLKVRHASCAKGAACTFSLLFFVPVPLFSKGAACTFSPSRSFVFHFAKVKL